MQKGDILVSEIFDNKMKGIVMTQYDIVLEQTIARLRALKYLDTSFEGKEVHRVIIEPLSKGEAFDRYCKLKHGRRPVVWGEVVRQMSYTIPEGKTLDVMIMKFNRDINNAEATAEMNALGVRPLSGEEIIQYGIVHPLHQKKKSFVGLGSIYAGDFDRTPCRSLVLFMDWGRQLALHWGVNGSHKSYRFPVVCK